MVKVIDNNKEQLCRLCRQYGVRRLEVFGSGADARRFTEHSDLDFLVDFLPMPPIEHSDAYFNLLNDLRQLFSRPVDLLEIKAVDNPYLMESINQTRTELYAA
ncbi:MAG: nucleotidyltransferase domain-containing protein [Anaerohalosphaeraceae bacterium]